MGNGNVAHCAAAAWRSLTPWVAHHDETARLGRTQRVQVVHDVLYAGLIKVTNKDGRSSRQLRCLSTVLDPNKPRTRYGLATVTATDFLNAGGLEASEQVLARRTRDVQ